LLFERFHVDKLSSAHVYVRLPEGITWDAMPAALVEDCAQLVKENSIEGAGRLTGAVRLGPLHPPLTLVATTPCDVPRAGCKKASVQVCYTPWSNLKKTGDMDVGQVGFHNPKLVRPPTCNQVATLPHGPHPDHGEGAPRSGSCATG